MSPHDIKVLLHHYAVTAPWPYEGSPACRDTIEWMVKAELLEKSGEGRAVTTERGNALVAMLCATPLPEVRFVDPRDGKVVEISP